MPFVYCTRRRADITIIRWRTVNGGGGRRGGEEPVVASAPPGESLAWRGVKGERRHGGVWFMLANSSRLVSVSRYPCCWRLLEEENK